MTVAYVALLHFILGTITWHGVYASLPRSLDDLVFFRAIIFVIMPFLVLLLVACLKAACHGCFFLMVMLVILYFKRAET